MEPKKSKSDLFNKKHNVRFADWSRKEPTCTAVPLSKSMDNLEKDTIPISDGLENNAKTTKQVEHERRVDNTDIFSGKNTTTSQHSEPTSVGGDVNRTWPGYCSPNRDILESPQGHFAHFTNRSPTAGGISIQRPVVGKIQSVPSQTSPDNSTAVKQNFFSAVSAFRPFHRYQDSQKEQSKDKDKKQGKPSVAFDVSSHQDKSERIRTVEGSLKTEHKYGKQIQRFNNLSPRCTSPRNGVQNSGRIMMKDGKELNFPIDEGELRSAEETIKSGLPKCNVLGIKKHITTEKCHNMYMESRPNLDHQYEYSQRPAVVCKLENLKDIEHERQRGYEDYQRPGGQYYLSDGQDYMRQEMCMNIPHEHQHFQSQGAQPVNTNNFDQDLTAPYDTQIATQERFEKAEDSRNLGFTAKFQNYERTFLGVDQYRQRSTDYLQKDDSDFDHSRVRHTAAFVDRSSDSSQHLRNFQTVPSQYDYENHRYITDQRSIHSKDIEPIGIINTIGSFGLSLHMPRISSPVHEETLTMTDTKTKQDATFQRQDALPLTDIWRMNASLVRREAPSDSDGSSVTHSHATNSLTSPYRQSQPQEPLFAGYVNEAQGSCNSTGTLSEGPVCRICHEGDLEEVLVSPCYCAGSVGLLHVSCLQRWLGASNKTTCEICNFEFLLERKPEPFINFLRSPGTSREKRNLICDVVCFCIITPVTVVTSWLCISGAFEYFQPSRWERSGLIALASCLLVMYLIWLIVAIRHNYSLWKDWKMFHQDVKLRGSPITKKSSPGQLRRNAGSRNTNSSVQLQSICISIRAAATRRHQRGTRQSQNRPSRLAIRDNPKNVIQESSRTSHPSTKTSRSTNTSSEKDQNQTKDKTKNAHDLCENRHSDDDSDEEHEEAMIILEDSPSLWRPELEYSGSRIEQYSDSINIWQYDSNFSASSTHFRSESSDSEATPPIVLRMKKPLQTYKHSDSFVAWQQNSNSLLTSTHCESNSNDSETILKVTTGEKTLQRDPHNGSIKNRLASVRHQQKIDCIAGGISPPKIPRVKTSSKRDQLSGRVENHPVAVMLSSHLQNNSSEREITTTKVPIGKTASMRDQHSDSTQAWQHNSNSVESGRLQQSNSNDGNKMATKKVQVMKETTV
ncbi:hypothetical protein CHS0354_014311 [Potamilus streckersoni]|uniref:RING-CH-type domain-containing protein n=1 Tax=Potamilus streckersoni TaxID=2493646 RepID=A0AAE0SKX9_9BIVA|nr:hypothetical protein CHS0354_014311 [Potamilus streckersoni]